MKKIEELHMEGQTLTLPVRDAKPRKYGITSVTDIGIPCGELSNILETYHNLIDIAKLGIGSAYIDPALRDKIAIYSKYEIPVYFGGTLFEKYYYQGKLDDYLIFLNRLGINYVEISNGTSDIEPEKMTEIISRLNCNFNVLAEVGKKEQANDFTLDEWVSVTKQFLEAGCHYAILEGRNTGKNGIYKPDGTLRQKLINMVTEAVDQKRVIFEAPRTQNQSQLINLFGNNVNIGNVFLRDILQVESQRQGLFSETFFS